jgi:hypothetical protein
MVKTIHSKWRRNELLDIQRWENEGGQMIENNSPLRISIQYLPVNPRRHDKSLEWNKRFVIEPFRPRKGILLTNKIQTNEDRVINDVSL